MDSFQTPMDLTLWLNADLIRRQNLLKSQFKEALEEVGNSFSQVEFQKISRQAGGTKLSKGNDLLGFPYQVLDLVRDFNPENGVNIRILNWFGNGLFLTILLGKTRQNPINELLDLGFSFGLSEEIWDYPDLILNGNVTHGPLEIVEKNQHFKHWILKINPSPNPKELSLTLIDTVKKIIGILNIPA